MSITTEMLFLFTVSWLLCGPLLVLGITVSPDSGKRNKTGEQIFEDILLNKTNETNESMTDRNRRLIPYMTFYMPNDFSSNQHYNYIPEQQQKQMIALYQSYQPPRNRIEQQHQPQQQQHQQQQQFQIRYPYPTQKPKYQAILYGNRHQLSSQGKDPNHHQRIPISFKESNAVKAGAVYQHPSTTKVNVNPFVPSNKLPGHFKPIIYIHQTGNVDYSRYPQPDPGTLQQYNDVLSEQQNNYQHDENQGVQSPVAVHTTPSSNLPTILLPSSRPLYPLANDVQQEQHHQQHQPEHVQQQSETSQNLTPQQKYVEYLREQLRYKQQQYYQQQPKQAFIINSSPPPQVGANVISYESPEHIPVNQIVYQSQMRPTGDDANESYNSSPSPRPMYNHPSSSQPFDYNNNYSPSSPRPPAHDYPDYLEVIVQDSQQQQKQQQQQQPQQQQKEQQVVSITPEKQSGFNQVTFVTTASPIMLSSVSPIYNNHQTSERFRINKFSKPIQSSAPVESPIPIDMKQLVYIPPQIKYKPEMRPTYIPQPTSAPQIIRQHLTETTQVPPPTLTTYHPNYVTSKPNYNSPISRPSIIHGSYKPKITQKLKPIIVTKPTSQALVHHKQQKVNSVQNESFTNITENSLTDILHKLQDSNQLPKTFTADNIDNSIRTLIKILNNLKQSQTIVENPPQHHEEDYDDYDDMPPLLDPSHPSPNSGRPGIDFPVFAEIPRTSFNCKEQRYKGFFGDPETNCQVWHYCDLNGGQASFLCPNGTIFSQVALTCDWWFNVKCSSTAQLYVLNERLYKYILPLTPKFPEDYSGPLVDKYLALKFKEMEDKMRREKTKGKMKSQDEEEDEEEETAEETVEDDEEDTVHSTTKNSENIENKIQDPGDENDNSIVTTTPSLQLMPIIVSSTEESFLPTPSSPKISVESEKVEVIEIKTDGNSGHLIPPQIFNSGLKK